MVIHIDAFWLIVGLSFMAIVLILVDWWGWNRGYNACKRIDDLWFDFLRDNAPLCSQQQEGPAI